MENLKVKVVLPDEKMWRAELRKLKSEIRKKKKALSAAAANNFESKMRISCEIIALSTLYQLWSSECDILYGKPGASKPKGILYATGKELEKCGG